MWSWLIVITEYEPYKDDEPIGSDERSSMQPHCVVMRWFDFIHQVLRLNQDALKQQSDAQLAAIKGLQDDIAPAINQLQISASSGATIAKSMKTSVHSLSAHTVSLAAQAEMSESRIAKQDAVLGRLEALEQRHQEIIARLESAIPEESYLVAINRKLLRLCEGVTSLSKLGTHYLG